MVKGFDSNSTTPEKLSCFASFLSGWTIQIIFNTLFFLRVMNMSKLPYFGDRRLFIYILY